MSKREDKKAEKAAKKAEEEAQKAEEEAKKNAEKEAKKAAKKESEKVTTFGSNLTPAQSKSSLCYFNGGRILRSINFKINPNGKTLREKVIL